MIRSGLPPHAIALEIGDDFQACVTTRKPGEIVGWPGTVAAEIKPVDRRRVIAVTGERAPMEHARRHHLAMQAVSFPQSELILQILGRQ